MPLSIGQQLSRYLLQELIGEGGSAQVFRAEDTLLGREVALKVLHEELISLDRERFLREVRVLSRLSHPGIIAIHDLGVHQEGTSTLNYFTMPLLTGGPISRLGPLEDSPQSIEPFFNAVEILSLALDYLHAGGLIHRDLTPANLLLGADGLPRIMDFGLVSLSEHTRQLTRSGITLGTPQYMSPEQARGSGVNHLSDLYALGAVLYRVVCGSPPFVGDNDQSVLFQHVYERVTDPRELNPAVPDALALLLLALLSKKPQHRPQSGVALHQQLILARQSYRAQASAQYRGGRTRSGEQRGGPAWPAGLQEEWQAALGGEITWPAAVVGAYGRLAVGMRNGQLVSLGSGGEARAVLSARDEVTAPATLLPDGVIYGAWDGALRRADLGGTLRWSHQTRAELTGAPTLWGELVLVPSRDGHLHAVKLASGELAWAYRATGPIAASPLVWAATALIVDENGWLYALDAHTGAQLWKAEVGVTHATPALVQPTRGEAVLLVPTWKGEVHALKLELRQGRAHLLPDLLWTYDLEEELWAAPAATPQQVIVAGWSGGVWCLGLHSGEELWHHRTQGRLTASPVISEGVVYLASEAGELQALALEGGRVLWQRQEPQGVQATPLAAGGRLVVAFMDGTLRGYR